MITYNTDLEMERLEYTAYGLVDLNEIEMMSVDGGISKKMKEGLHEIVDGIKKIVDDWIDRL